MKDNNTTSSNRSDAQNAASRANGARSKGPITPEGKARSSQNAMKHGFRSRRVVLANESQERYDALFAAFHAEWNPIGATENELLVQMVNAAWQLRRVETIETASLDCEMFLLKTLQDSTFTMNTPAMRHAGAVQGITNHNPVSLEYLNRAHIRFTRAFHTAIKTLTRVQTMRLGHAPTLTPVVAEASPLSKEPNAPPPNTQPNYCEPEIFAWTSQFTPTPQRPNFDHRQWRMPNEANQRTPAA